MDKFDGYLSEFKRYEEVAKNVDLTQIFPEFKKHYGLFNFIIAFGEGKHKSDPEAIQMAMGLSPKATFTMLQRGPSKAGGDYLVVDVVESRHILLLAYLKSYFGDKKLGNVLEIGGGYGNFLRLAYEVFEYESWSIIDLEFITRLQNWFLEQEKVPLDNVTIYPNTELPDREFDLVIGTHSLSEFDLDTFTKYYDKYVKKAKVFLYASHNSLPSSDLLKAKMDRILEDFTLKTSRKYELGNATMYIFERNS